MLSSELQEAIENLHIQDVYFDKIDCEVLERPTEADIENEKISFQTKYGLKSLEVGENGESNQVLIHFEAGIRWIKGAEDPSESETILAMVEAEFVAKYISLKELSEKGLTEFAEKNSGIHVWPYWREFVSSACERMRLPRIMLPTKQFSRVEE
tara:strand:+ start:156 stop:617 length:462 start_codon:yes stop_codon:yes gene_type:complete